MKKSRQQYDLDHKRRIVAEYLSGTTAAEDIAKREDLARGQIYKWRVQLERRARAERIERVHRHQAAAGSVQRACQMIDLSPSTYYYEPKRSRESREREDASLRDAIETVQAEFPKAGYRTVQVYLRRAGRFVGERRIRRMMKGSRCTPRSNAPSSTRPIRITPTGCTRTCCRGGCSRGSTRPGVPTSRTSAS